MIPESVFEFVIEKLEGGEKITRDPRDPGGLTKWGVSQRAHPSVDIEALSREGAMRIYTDYYWKPARCYEYSAPVALCVFDACVNQGVEAAVRMMQVACGVRADGVIGPVTLKVMKAYTPEAFIKRFMKLRAARYLTIDSDVEETYEKGWMNRLIDVTVQALTNSQ